MLIEEELIAGIAAGELEAFAALDKRGIFCADHESARDLAERLQLLNQRTAEMNRTLAEGGAYTIEGITVCQDEQIPPELFQEGHAITAELFHFQVDWVQGFFIDPHFSMFFGGGAFCFFPDFFALFIIRRSFRDRQRWLFYQRRELLAHELCHVARLSFEARMFEEICAYQTAFTRFRRYFGGIFQRPRDSFLFLGVTALLFASQLCQTFIWPALPGWFFWLLFALTIGWLFLRQKHLMDIFGQARQHLGWLFPEEHCLAVLCRCSDRDILDLSQLPDQDAAFTWLQRRCSDTWRWKVNTLRFCSFAASTTNETKNTAVPDSQ
jgi:hypothetical protein